MIFDRQPPSPAPSSLALPAVAFGLAIALLLPTPSLADDRFVTDDRPAEGAGAAHGTATSLAFVQDVNRGGDVDRGKALDLDLPPGALIDPEHPGDPLPTKEWPMRTDLDAELLATGAAAMTVVGLAIYCLTDGEDCDAGKDPRKLDLAGAGRDHGCREAGFSLEIATPFEAAAQEFSCDPDR